MTNLFFQLRANFNSMTYRRTGNPRFEFLDGLRALSIIWVLLFHCCFYLGLFISNDRFNHIVQDNILGVFFSQGHVGVDVFFSLSGFLIGYFLLKEYRNTGNLNIKNFYIKRAFRLLPAYYFSMFIWFFISAKNVENVWANILYVNNFLDVQNQYFTWGWSLAIEEQFYIIFPFFIIFVFKYFKFPFINMVFFLLLSFVIRFFIINHFNITYPYPSPFGSSYEEYLVFFNQLYEKPYTRYGGILVGVMAAYCYVYTNIVDKLNGSRLLRFICLFTGIIPFIFYIGFMTSETVRFYCGNFSDFYLTAHRNFISIGTSTLILYSMTFKGNSSFIGKFFKLKMWYPIACISYSSYLLQIPVIIVIYKLIGVDENFTLYKFLLVIPFIFLIVTIVSSLLFVLIEKPFIKLRVKLLHLNKDAYPL